VIVGTPIVNYIIVAMRFHRYESK